MSWARIAHMRQFMSLLCASEQHIGSTVPTTIPRADLEMECVDLLQDDFTDRRFPPDGVAVLQIGRAHV